MILLHDQMNKEASFLKGVVEDVFKIPVRLIEDNLDNLFMPIPQFEGFYYQPRTDFLTKEFPDTNVFLLTSKDLFVGHQSRDDEWVFGASFLERISVQSAARLKGPDSRPRISLEIETSLYDRRLSFVTIHEIGHHVVKAPHYRQASWINARTGLAMPLGPHCNDNSCVMYEVVDVVTPPREEGYLMLGDERLYDAGMDEHLERLKPDWFCSKCLGHIVIQDSYRGIGNA